ncbi:hypothetical protein BOX15_Mlig008714g1, partial [Macrostomum lignano]
YYHSLVLKTVLARQNDITGLIPSTPSSDHAYIRDNTYAAMCTWALALAFKKVAEEDQDRARLRDLEGRTIKCMRSLLACMMRQADKVERFKHTRQPLDALHCKFSASSLSPVTGDSNYGHLQFDAVALYLLALAQMTASGLVLVYTAEETAFVQNLVFYLDAAYMTCDYGVWERGDKTNNGQPELNSTSIGMTKAALEALSELDLYGSSGGCRSFIHVMADDSQNCAAVLDTMLPRESCSKETDAGLLAVIGYPAFAVDREELVASTRNCIDSMLQGRYGYRRFLRDGYRTAVEDPNRLYYEPWELRQFENIECEWPLFLCYQLLDAQFADSDERADRFARLLDRLALLNSDGLPQMPESYSVPGHLVAAERAAPGSQDRHPVGALPHLWTQSLYVICQLLRDKFLRPQEIDPIGRRLGLEAKPDLVVQVVVVAEDAKIRRTLETQFGLKQVQDFAEMYKETKIRVFPAKVLSHFYRHLGKCHQLGLSGRQSSEVGILATSKLYIVGQRTVAFTPQFLDHHSFYLSLDLDFLLDMLRTDVAFLRRTWSAVGRPLFIIPVYHWYFNADSSEQAPSLYTTIKKLQSGYINGTRVTLGKLADFVDTSCVTNMTFLDKGQGDDELAKAKAAVEGRRRGRTRLGSGASATAADAAAVAMRFRAGSVGARKKSVVLSSAAALELALSSLSAADTDGEGEGEPFGDEEAVQFKVGSPESKAGPVPASGVQPSRRRRSSGFGLLGMVPNLNEMINESRRVAEETTVTHRLKNPTMLNEDSVDSMKRMVHCARATDQHDSGNCMASMNEQQLLKRLAQSDHLYEQFDLLFHLYHTKGLDYSTGWEDANGSGQPVTVRDLVKELYERAGSLRQWWLVRYTAGMLDKRVEKLPMFLTDLLVRQKHVTVGLPPEPRETVISSPRGGAALAQLIRTASDSDPTLGVLTQELLVYLSMLARTEPQLLASMYRIRVGLVIQVMGSEMARALNISAEEATEHLLGLSPYKMKTLLHHILSGKEFHAEYSEDEQISLESDSRVLDFRPRSLAPSDGPGQRPGQWAEERLGQTMSSDRRGQWLRRRRIDGALNRVPAGFYRRMWRLLEYTEGVSIYGQIIGQYLTREMTAGEVKFALHVEAMITAVPVPEYRQLVVEALSLLVRLPDCDQLQRVDLHRILPAEQLVHRANYTFLSDQLSLGGDACACCAVPDQIDQLLRHEDWRRGAGATYPALVCGGACGVCAHFYDTAPSGRFGTLTYLLRALPDVVQLPEDEDGMLGLECPVQ